MCKQLLDPPTLTYSRAITTKDHGLMQILAHENNSITRQYLARNPHIPLFIVKKLAKDSHYLVRYEIYCRYQNIEEIDILLRVPFLCYEMRR